MKKNKKILITICILAIFLIVLGTIVFIFNSKKDDENYANEIINNIYTELDKNDIQYQENVTIEDLKNQTSITGNDEIYEIGQEYDGRNVLTVKANVKYKVAFAGMIKKTAPKFEELDQILEQNLPKYTGIWIEPNSRENILNLFNNSQNTNSQYTINKDGYLEITQKNSQTESDKKIENAINGRRQYILDLSSICYIVDDVTGEILDYNFENLDRYQTYEYFEDEDKSIVFINQNTHSQLSDLEILNSIIEIF